MKHFTLGLLALLCCSACAQNEAPDVAAVAATTAAATSATAATSALWGTDGEKWTPQSRLPFFALSGYHSGRDPIPDVKVVASVRDFGAKGDGTTDDTAAIARAVEATQNGALFFPAGRYVLTDTISIAKSNLVLRGAGPDQSVFVIPQPLAAIRGAKTSDGTKSSYSFSGGFIEVRGIESGAKIADVAQGARRGDRILTLAAPAAPLLKKGDWIRLQMFDDAHSLGRYLHAEQGDAGENTYSSRVDKPLINWAARVEATAGAQITLDRPLRLDVRLQWKPQVLALAPSVREVGIEKLGFEFAGAPTKPHLKEEGFNAIHIMPNVVDSWVRDVTVTDADIGVIVGGARFCTVENTRFRAAKREGITGHHALWATGGAQDCLFRDFKLETLYIHDLTVEGFASGNVFRSGSGVSINFDHHRNAPYENLFSNINVGNAKRIWESSGRGDRGPHSAARATFWNIRADKGTFRPAPDWPQINVIGVAGLEPDMTPDGAWIEPISPLAPPELYAAQRAALPTLLR